MSTPMAELEEEFQQSPEREQSEASPSFSLERFLETEQRKDLLRFSTAGSVDDGKSTLIGRLLYDSRNVYEDHVRSVTKVQGSLARGAIDFAQLTDGLRAEREQGITIDVAYRYFSTERRKFIIADTPGHEQYTRNMATGASTADLAIILVDAGKGLLAQSRRHVYITSLLGIRQLVLAVNKMDLVDFSPEVFDRIEEQFRALVEQLGGAQVTAIPLSALDGDNVVERSLRTPWYSGPTLLEHLEETPAGHQSAGAAFRLPVQRVIRPKPDYEPANFRGFAGQIASGAVRVGDEVVALPSGRSSRVKSINTFDGDLEEAIAPQSIAITLEDELDISRGDFLVSVPASAESSLNAGLDSGSQVSLDRGPQTGRAFTASLVWFDAKPLDPTRSYWIKHANQTVSARVRAILHRVDVQTLQRESVGSLRMNEIGQVEVEAARTLFFDPYSGNRTTGSFILIDSESNSTAAAGMIEAAVGAEREEAMRELVRVPQAPVLLVPGAQFVTDLEREMTGQGLAVVRTRLRHPSLLRELSALGICTLVELDEQEADNVRLADHSFGEGALLLQEEGAPAARASEIVSALRTRGVLPLSGKESIA